MAVIIVRDGQKPQDENSSLCEYAFRNDDARAELCCTDGDTTDGDATDRVLLSAAQRFCLSTSVEAEDTGDVVVAPTVVFDLVTAETFTGLADFVSKYASTSTFCTRTDL